jgi:hypothetical protein
MNALIDAATLRGMQRALEQVAAARRNLEQAQRMAQAMATIQVQHDDCTLFVPWQPVLAHFAHALAAAEDTARHMGVQP